MKTREFNYIYHYLTSENGKQYFEEYFQYMGWFFLDLTEKQHKKITDLLIKFGYPTEKRGSKTWIKIPNGIQLSLPE